MLPEILKQGEENTKEYWEKRRRKEILELFENNVYGRTPVKLPQEQKVSVSDSKSMDGGAVRYEKVYVELRDNGKTCGFHCHIYIPKREDHKPMPVALMVNPFSMNRNYSGKEDEQMPYDLVTSLGYIGVRADVDEICPDDAKGYQDGLWQLFPGEGESAWGAIGMWAYAASRVVDYLVSRADVDAERIAICGCSRGGKAALWCGAQDERISLIISNVSGCTGAAVTRGKRGEHVKQITSAFPYWLCKKYGTFADMEEQLPVDQHMLLALCAPRPLYVSSASEDTWADPEKEFEGAFLAGDAYHLYGKKGLEEERFPDVNHPVGDGFIAYHVRCGEHGCTRYDWQQYLGFMKRFF